jgi:hypothetical protein
MSTVALKNAREWTVLTTHTAASPVKSSLGGYDRYHQTARTLPLLEQIKLGLLAWFIVDSYAPGSRPIVQVEVIGHADTDFQRGRKFEQDISEKRAADVAGALQRSVADLAPIQVLVGPHPRSIKWLTTGVGAREPHPDNLRARKSPKTMTEADRKLNRRVELLMTYAAGTVPGVPNEVVRIFLTFAEQLALGKVPKPPTIPPWLWDPKVMPKPGTPPYVKLKADVEKALENVDTKTVLSSISEIRERLSKNSEEEIWLHDFLKGVEEDIRRDREEKNK